MLFRSKPPSCIPGVGALLGAPLTMPPRPAPPDPRIPIPGPMVACHPPPLEHLFQSTTLGSTACLSLPPEFLHGALVNWIAILLSLLNTMHQASVSMFSVVCELQINAGHKCLHEDGREASQIVYSADHSQTSGQEF